MHMMLQSLNLSTCLWCFGIFTSVASLVCFFLKQSVIDYPVNVPLKLTIVPDE